MEEEELDYMSDTFITECSKNDIKPGLLGSHAEKYKLHSLKRKQERDELNRKKNPSKKLLEIKNREDGLNKPLEEDNKGFALLQKMGYKPGTGIGKSVIGVVEPISIKVKSGRDGLGRSEIITEYRKYKANSSEVDQKQLEKYRLHFKQLFNEKHITRDLKTSQNICEHLDKKHGTDNPVRKWYWPPSDTESSNEEKQNKRLTDETDGEDDTCNNDVMDYSDQEEDLEDEDQSDEGNLIKVYEKLCTITSYLRCNYYYCIWCGVEYQNENDLKSDCPGDTRDSH